MVAERLTAMAAAFDLPGPVERVEPLGSGNVNDTFLVETAWLPAAALRAAASQPAGVPPSRSGHGQHPHRRGACGGAAGPGLSRAGAAPLGTAPGGAEPRLDRRAWVERGEEFWRMLTFVEGCRSVDVVASADQAREVGFGLGLFHHLISDLPPDRLADTLEGFHVTPAYLAHYDAVLSDTPAAAGSDLAHCRAFVEDRRGFAPVLEQARAAGLLLPRPIHGDPKVNNVMLDLRIGSGRGPGGSGHGQAGPDPLRHRRLSAFLLQSGPGRKPRTWRPFTSISISAGDVLSGYLAAASGFLTESDYDHLYAAIRLICFELGLRFFTDHLAGDVYFRADHRGHNLQRALVQFRLTQSIEAQERSDPRPDRGAAGPAPGRALMDLSSAVDFRLHPFEAGAVSADLRLDGRVGAATRSAQPSLSPGGAPGGGADAPPGRGPRAAVTSSGPAPASSASWPSRGSAPTGRSICRPPDTGTSMPSRTTAPACGRRLPAKPSRPRPEVGERSLTLRVTVPLPPAIPTGAPLRLGISAVIEAPGEELSYWALAHPGPEPDFHRRDGFLLRL